LHLSHHLSLSTQIFWSKQCRLATSYFSKFQPFLWSGTLCSNFDCSQNQSA